jgi:hypothetical protein
LHRKAQVIEHRVVVVGSADILDDDGRFAHS